MGRMYTVQSRGVSVSNVQDIIAAYAGASRVIKVHAVQLGASGQTTVSNLGVTLKHLAATVTPGSGGTAPTPSKTNPNDAAAAFTSHINDTSQATSSGTVFIFADEFNPINGYYWQAPRPGQEPEATINEALVFTLDNTPAATLLLNATIWVEEL